MAERCYRGQNVTVRLRTRPGALSLHIEHDDGAALIAPEVDFADRDGTLLAEVEGFDGTSYVIEANEENVRIRASQATLITAGQLELTVERSVGLENKPSRVRRTGDEVTMPIGVGEPRD